MYNARNHPRKADILFIGDSLMFMGVNTELFASMVNVDASRCHKSRQPGGQTLGYQLACRAFAAPAHRRPEARRATD